MVIGERVNGALFLLLLVVIWQALYINVNVNRAIIPPPSMIFLALIKGVLSGALITNSAASLSRVIVGFSAAAMAAVGLGLLLGRYAFFRSLLEPIIELLKPIPPIAWIPVAILLFGLGDVPAYFIVFFGAFFPIYLNTSFGVLRIPIKYVNLSKTLELSDWRFFKDVLFKYSLPYIFTGLKVGISMAWMSVIAAEMVGAQSGLGYYILLNQTLLDAPNVLAGMFAIGVLGYALTSIMNAAEKRFAPWVNG
ncbi:Binding-protein-dependent transport system inner membrane component [uncultured archaeon]|nr:Binding-protein-dependent transport system inner membrane component [uncultured archaeon]